MVADRLPKFGGVRTGGRSARVVEQVTDATIALLGEVGYGALRVDEVAERSGVNKTTIYRRWPTKSQLVAAALAQYHEPVGAPDTGDLARDLTDMFSEAVAAQSADVKRSLMRMLQTERRDPELDAILVSARDRLISIRRVRLDAAIARGELPRRTDVMLLLYTMSSAVYSRLLAFDEPPSRALVAEIVSIIVAGARAHWSKPVRTAARAGSRAAPRAARRPRR